MGYRIILIFRTVLTCFFLFMMLSISGCFLLKKKYDVVYTTDNINNNYIDLKNIKKLKGMKKEQIIYIFGRPIISDVFDNAYHYIFYIKNKNTFEKKILNIFFEKNKVFLCTIE